VLVLSHTINPAHAWMLDCAQAAGTPLIYDIDENLLEPPDDIPGLEFHRDPARQATVRRALTQAVLVRTYAPALQRYLCRFNEHVVRTDGPVDWRLVPEAVQRDHQRVRVVYATSRTTEDTIGAMVVEPLRRLLDAEPTVDLTVWGPQFGDLAGHPRVRFRPFVRDYDRYFQEFARAGFDIGVAPMPDEVFYQSKTATKFREYAACRIAGVYADVEMYRDCVADGETGLLVSASPDAWLHAIRRLVADVGLRQRIQSAAYAYARTRYSAERIDGDWLDHITYARERRKAPTRASTPPAARTSAIGRVGALIRSGGMKAALGRAAAQLNGIWQLLAWEMAIRRVHRQHRS